MTTTAKPIDDGGPAFPVGDQSTHPLMVGMSLRDYFAGQALAGMLASDGNDPRWSPKDALEQPGGGKWIEPLGVAYQSYAIADAMLKARKDSPQP